SLGRMGEDWAAGTRRLYVNGVLAVSGAAQAANGGGQLWMGASEGVTEFFGGVLDEVRISNVARSADWIAAEVTVGNDGLVSFVSDNGAANQPPVLSAIANQTVNEGTAATFTAQATDPDAGQTLTYSMASAPAGAPINSSTGAFTWTPSEAQGPGSYTVTVQATDNGSPSLSDSKSLTITVNEVNQAPVLAAIANQSVGVGQTLTFTASGTDADVPANTLTYSLTGAPTGAGINATTGAFTGTPASGQEGSYSFGVRVTDNGSPALSASQTVNVTVTTVPPGWWDAAWTKRKKLVFDRATRATDLLDFPLLVVLD